MPDGIDDRVEKNRLVSHSNPPLENRPAIPGPPAKPAAQAVAVKLQTILPASPPLALKTSSWSLVLQDDFLVADLATPTSHWQTRFDWGPTMTGEPQYYTSYDKIGGNPSCSKGGLNHIYSGGKLRLTVKYEPGNYKYEVWHWTPTGAFYTTCEPYDFTSAMLWSKQQFLYGKFEICCTIPHNGTKTFPAFWLFSGPPYREIDVFEFDTPDVANNILTNVHIHESLDFARHHRDPAKTDGINDYPDQFQVADVGGYHVYTLEWRPNGIAWFFDGVLIRRLAGHSPWMPMNLIANVSLAPWHPLPSAADLPAEMAIDYIRVYRWTDPEFLHAWDNQGSGKIAVWTINRTDRFLTGKFSGAARDELLAIAVNGWSHLMHWDGAAWQYDWGNGGTGKIASWNMKPDDRYIVGDFDGDGRDEVLVVAASNGWAHLMRWNGSAWQYVWGNGGVGKIALWNLNSTDRFVAGDFNGDARCELLAVAAQGWAHMMRWDGSAWAYAWGNNGDSKIAAWNIGPGDRFVAGRFRGAPGTELLALSVTGWVHVIEWGGGGAWNYVWGNNGNGYIGGVPLISTNQYIAADFAGTGTSQLLAVAGGAAQLLRLNGSTCDSAWHNDFGGTIHLWFMKGTDRYVAGNFTGSKPMLLAASENGWSQLMKFEPLP